MKFSGVFLKIFFLLVAAHFVYARPLLAFAQSIETGAISGRIINEFNTGITGLVRLYAASSPQLPVRLVSTDSLGKYLIDELQPGLYYLVTANSHTRTVNYANQLFPGISCPFDPCDKTGGLAVPVSAGITTPGIDFRLKEAKKISGTITAAPQGSTVNVPLSESEVLLYDGLGRLLMIQKTDMVGRYSFDFLDAGSYYVSTKNQLGFIDEVYSNQPCPQEACDVLTGSRIELAESILSKNANFILRPGGLLSGTVYNAADGKALNGAAVYVYDPAGNRVRSASTDQTGSFLISSGIMPGNYFVIAQKTGFVKQLWGSGECPKNCTVTAGQPVTIQINRLTRGIDFRLYPASISPSVKDSDKDGLPDMQDACPLDAGKKAPEVCGCGVADTDSDLNGIADCLTNQQMKFELSKIRSLIGKLISLKPSQSSLRAVKTGELSTRVLNVSQLIKRNGASLKLNSGTLYSLDRQWKKLKNNLNKAVKSSGIRKKSYRRALRNFNQVYQLLS